MSAQLPPAGWQPDPSGEHQLRYWDGGEWTNHISDNGVQGIAAPRTPVAPVAPAMAPAGLPGVTAPAAAFGGAPMAPAMPKKKTTAVLLAVFLTFWTWCYTYKVDAWKFWLNLVLSTVTLGIWAVFVAWPWAIIDAAVRSEQWYQQYPNGDAYKLQQAQQMHQMQQQPMAMPASYSVEGLPAPVQTPPQPPSPPSMP